MGCIFLAVGKQAIILTATSGNAASDRGRNGRLNPEDRVTAEIQTALRVISYYFFFNFPVALAIVQSKPVLPHVHDQDGRIGRFAHALGRNRTILYPDTG